jgi:choline-sulfatase
MDERVGRLLNKLKELGIYDDTAIIYTSDHGESMGHHGLWFKCNMFERSSHIPLIVKIPGNKPRRVDRLVNLLDVFPTTCDYMGVPIPDGLDGISLKPLIENGRDDKRPDFTFSEYNGHGTPNGWFMIRWKQYKYIYYCYDKPQLFDLEQDPGENHSLIESDVRDNPYWEIAEECHKRLLSVCNPYEVDTRAKAFQEKMRQRMGVTNYDSDVSEWGLPHIEPL